MEDVRIGRKSRSGQVNVTVGATSQALVSAAETRIGLVFCAPVGGNVTISLDQTAVLGKGINLTPTSNPVFLWLPSSGDLATRQWSIIGSAGGITLGMIETFFPDR